MPSTWSMVKGFTKELSRYIKEGAPNVGVRLSIKLSGKRVIAQTSHRDGNLKL